MTAALGSGGDALVATASPRTRGGYGAVRGEAAETMDGVASGADAPVDGCPSLETRRRTELPIAHRSLNLLRNNLPHHVKQMRKSKGKRGGGMRGARSVGAHRKKQKTAAAMAESGELIRRPGSVLAARA